MMLIISCKHRKTPGEIYMCFRGELHSKMIKIVPISSFLRFFLKSEVTHCQCVGTFEMSLCSNGIAFLVKFCTVMWRRPLIIWFFCSFQQFHLSVWIWAHVCSSKHCVVWGWGYRVFFYYPEIRGNTHSHTCTEKKWYAIILLCSKLCILFEQK